MTAQYPMRRHSPIPRLNADELPDPYRAVIAQRVRDDAAVFAERPDLKEFDRPSVWGEFYPAGDPPAGSPVRVVRMSSGVHARMLLSEHSRTAASRATKQASEKPKKFDPDYPAPIYTDYAARVATALREQHGVRPTTTELARLTGVPRNAFNNNYFRARLRRAGVRRTKRGGLNRWHLETTS